MGNNTGSRTPLQRIILTSIYSTFQIISILSSSLNPTNLALLFQMGKKIINKNILTQSSLLGQKFKKKIDWLVLSCQINQGLSFSNHKHSSMQYSVHFRLWGTVSHLFLGIFTLDRSRPALHLSNSHLKFPNSNWLILEIGHSPE